MFPILIALALLFDFLNGFHDSSNVVATVISSGSMRPRLALLVAAACHFLGPFLFGVAVATTVGEGLLRDEAISPAVVIAALFSAVLWNLATWYIGLPSSSSHALIGGLLGAAVLSGGLEVVRFDGLTKILLALLVSPPIGLLAGFLVMRLTLFAAQKAHPKVNHLFRRLQSLTLVALALSHGTNDAQKTMGVIAMGLLAAGYIERFVVPVWVIAASASAIALGTSFGGWRLIRTLGGKIFRVRPVHGFASQVAGAAVILGAALMGGPVSTTQVMSSAIMGVGAAERLGKVRWLVLRDLVVAWALTIPLTAILAAAAYFVINRFFG
ncbi:MAG: inorganic phosphate transporter [Chloroflexi bacterium RBG_13_66_10]|nr:MAG: inorganic phosphate transporter [Chloroflexi bacterium RBG_13_66_10]